MPLAPRSPIRRRPRNDAYVLAAAFVGYALVAIAYTYPLVWRLGTVVPHDPGDPLLSTALLWWNAHVLPFTDRWWNGFTFYPAGGMLALSDARLGETAIAGPLQWLGISPIAAYSLTLLATFPLCAIAAHWLAWVVTKRHDAAAIAGLAYGFCPFRAAHLEHLELLAAFGMPIALGALHRYRETYRGGWLCAFAAALVVQGLCTGYYVLFFGVLLAMWIFWFVGRDRRALIAIGVASTAAAVALAPLAIGYARIHARFGLTRQLVEIVAGSGDLASLAVTPPLLALWGWTSRWLGPWHPERQLFPGVTIVALALIGGIAAWRRHPAAGDRLDRVSLGLVPVAAILASIAACAWWLAPWRIELPGVLIASDAPFKPFSLAFAAAAASLGLSSRVRRAYRRESPLAFYLLATALLYLCSFGPKPTAWGHQFLYEPPYAWLMQLPGFGAIRVPARFAMVAMLSLSTAGAIAFARFELGARMQRAAPVLLAIAVLADGWIHDLPLARVPDMWPAQTARDAAAVLELPLGEPFHDLAATFRGTIHRRPVVNGNSGFEPRHYATLRVGLEERDAAIFEGFPSRGTMLAVVDERDDPGGEWAAWLTATGRASPVGPPGRWKLFALAPGPEPPAICRGESAAVAGARDANGAVDVRRLTDGDPRTFWGTVRQRRGDFLQLDLGLPVRPCAVRLSLGDNRIGYPRALRIDTSLDGVSWTTVATRRTAGLALRGVLRDPQTVPIDLPIAPTTGRFIRMRLEEDQPNAGWVVTDVSVLVTRGD